MDTEKRQELQELDERELEQTVGGKGSGSGYVCTCGWTEYSYLVKDGSLMMKCANCGRESRT